MNGLGRPRVHALTRLVDAALERSLPRRSRSAAPRLLTAMRYCLFTGGKRFRPLLCLGAAEAVGAPAQKALTVACAIEMIHTYSLVHDDLPAMDDADERRGRPSCHRRFDEALAILTGDALLTLAFGRLASQAGPRALEILGVVADAAGTEGLIGGQVLDLDLMRQASPAVARLNDVARRKTGALITASVVAGGLAGGAGRAQLSRLERYGRRMGQAFQLVDDIHDHDGVAKAAGTNAARRNARGLVQSAIDELAPFKGRGLVLRELAGWLKESA